MSFPTGLARVWVSIQVPGTVAASPHATYVAYDVDSLPPVPEGVEHLEWLAAAPRHPEDYLASSFDDAAQRDLSWEGVAARVPDVGSLPDDFRRFIADGAALRDRLRSATDCYFDLGDELVEVDDGHLLHLISDSQWVHHWLLYLGADGRSSVIGTTYPAGFRLGPDDLDAWAEQAPDYVVVADSFAEFLWRWWMDNEVFYKAKVDGVGLSVDEHRYVGQYGPSRAF